MLFMFSTNISKTNSISIVRTKVNHFPKQTTNFKENHINDDKDENNDRNSDKNDD